MKTKSFIKILIAIILAIFVGQIVGKDSKIFGITFHSIFDVGGTLFLNLLMLLVIPLIFSSIVTGIGKIGKESNLGRIGLKTFLLFVFTNFLAIMVGVLLVNLFKDYFMSSAKTISALKETVVIENQDTMGGLKGIILRIIPKNIFYTFSQGEMIGLIFFSILFGYGITKIEKKYQEAIHNFFQAIFNTMLTITHLVMKLLPLGVFFLVAKEFSYNGIETLKPLFLFSSIELIAIVLICFIIFPILLVLAKVNPVLHFKAVFPAIVTAFSTSSSSATLPVTMECLEEKAKVSNKICSIVTPLGTSINLSTTAMHIFVASAFIATAYGLNLNFTTQFTIFLLSIITTLGMASVPSGCLMTLIIVITALKIPAAGIGIIIAVDRILDMLRTAGNVFGVSVNTVIIAKSEGEKEVLKK